MEYYMFSYLLLDFSNRFMCYKLLKLHDVSAGKNGFYKSSIILMTFKLVDEYHTRYQSRITNTMVWFSLSFWMFLLYCIVKNKTNYIFIFSTQPSVPGCVGLRIIKNIRLTNNLS